MNDEQFDTLIMWLSIIANRLRIIMFTLSVLTGGLAGIWLGTELGKVILR